MVALLAKVYKSSAPKKELKKIQQQKLSIYTAAWKAVYSFSGVFVCQKTCVQFSIISTKTSIQSGANQQVALLNSVYRKLKGATKNRLYLQKAKAVAKKANETASLIKSLLMQLPETASTKTC